MEYNFLMVPVSRAITETYIIMSEKVVLFS